MFSSALKSFSSNINSNYSISSTPTSTAGPWKIYDAKKKSTGKSASAFILDRKSIDAHASALGRSNASALRKASEEVLERLKKEASSLARLRHPNILELVEPVEETRNGGLQFVTETVTASLSGLLQEKDNREREDQAGRNPAINVTEDSDTNSKDSGFELDDLEIQKGLEQISKALEFLHDHAGLVHGNLTPDAIFINSKFDWKISGLSFSSPPDTSDKTSSIVPINLAEVLNFDPRLPRSVQINLDYCSPDLVLDSNLNVAADMFSLGLLIIALYNFPHHSPLKANSSVSNYKRLFSSSLNIPSSSNGFLSSRPIPKDLTASVLPRLITRRPAQRMTAKEFQQSPYFDNILIATIRFLESFPAKTPKEKVQFMRGLSGAIPSFPKSVLEKKILTSLLEEMKDMDLLSLILQNIFIIVDQLLSGRKCFTERIMPRIKEIFIPVVNSKISSERELVKESGMMVVLENIRMISENCSAKDFKDYILPIIHLAIESPTHSVVDASLRSLPIFLPVLDFSTVKNELFPVIASVFSKTNSLGIKVRGLEAFLILCGGSNDSENTSDGLDGVTNSPCASKRNSTALDKHTMQEKILPLIRAIKTKEPAVAVAALNVLRQVGRVADPEFIALDILPVLWSMSLGPLLDLKQFQQFMELIRILSNRIEYEHTKKLQELSGSNENRPKINDAFMSFSKNTSPTNAGSSECTAIDFECLVKKSAGTVDSSNATELSWDTASGSVPRSSGPSLVSNFTWSASSPTNLTLGASISNPNLSNATPKPSCFDVLSPSITQNSKPLDQMDNFMQPLQPQPSSFIFNQSISKSMGSKTCSEAHPKIDWTPASASSPFNVKLGNSTQSSGISLNSSFSHLTLSPTSRSQSAFDLQTPTNNTYFDGTGHTHSSLSGPKANIFSLPHPPQFQTQTGISSATQRQQHENYSLPPPGTTVKSQQSAKKNGLEGWESLL